MNKFIYPEIKPGLYIVSLPVGCLSDISFRALHMLSNSDYVAGEDTRNVKSLFRLSSKKVFTLIFFKETRLLLLILRLSISIKLLFSENFKFLK